LKIPKIAVRYKMKKLLIDLRGLVVEDINVEVAQKLKRSI